VRASRKARGGPLSARTVLHHHRVLRNALQQALRWRLIPTNPADLVQPPRPTRKPVSVYSEVDARKLLAAFEGNWIQLPSAIALHTGMRRGEILALRWCDVDFERGAIRVRRSLEQVGSTLNFKSTKTGRGRVIAMPSVLVRLLKGHKAKQAAERLLMGPMYADQDLVCAGFDGSPIVPHILSDAFRAAVQKTGLGRVTFHGLRHTHATILLRAGVHPKVVSERLGHSTVGVTLDVYSHVLPDMQEQAAQAIDEAFGTG
jgi:integrase